MRFASGGMALGVTVGLQLTSELLPVVMAGAGVAL